MHGTCCNPCFLQVDSCAAVTLCSDGSIFVVHLDNLSAPVDHQDTSRFLESLVIQQDDEDELDQMRSDPIRTGIKKIAKSCWF
jgi:hypothetical protein